MNNFKKGNLEVLDNNSLLDHKNIVVLHYDVLTDFTKVFNTDTIPINNRSSNIYMNGAIVHEYRNLLVTSLENLEYIRERLYMDFVNLFTGNLYNHDLLAQPLDFWSQTKPENPEYIENVLLSIESTLASLSIESTLVSRPWISLESRDPWELLQKFFHLKRVITEGSKLSYSLKKLDDSIFKK